MSPQTIGPILPQALPVETIGDSVLKTTQERPAYPVGIPFKFDPEGVEQFYPGNTIICHIPPGSPLQPALQVVYDALNSHPTIGPITRLMPPASWHMTVFDGARTLECEPDMWPEGMEKLPLEEFTAKYSQDLRALGQKLEKEGLAGPYRMRVTGFGDMIAGFGLGLEGATAEEEQRMRRLRDRLSECLGFQSPNHFRYQFHITVAYWLRYMEGPLKADLIKLLDELLPTVSMEVELGALEFCTYEGMCHFERLFYVQKTEE